MFFQLGEIEHSGRRQTDLASTAGSALSGVMIVGSVFVVVGIALLAVVPLMATIGFDVEKSYNEGWNAYHAARVAAGAPLYTGNPNLIVNYPFLSFYLVAWLKPLFGTVLLTGRILNAVAYAATGALVALIVRCLGGATLTAIFAGACALGFQATQASAWIAVDEPQMLAQAVMLSGLLCYVSGPPTIRRLLACATLFAVGGFIKQILLAIPVAITVDLLWKDRRHFLLWCACACSALAGFAILSALITGGHEWPEILAPRAYDWRHIPYHARKLLITLKAPIAVALLYLLRRPPEQTPLLPAFGLVALAEGIGFSGGDGVSYNVYLEFTIFLGLIAGLALGQWRQVMGTKRGMPVGAVAALLAAAPLVIRAPHDVSAALALDATIHDEQTVEASDIRAKSILRRQTGTAFCENLLLCLEAGRAPTLDPFSVYSEIRVGRLSEAAFIAEIANRRFGIVELSTEIHPDPNRPLSFSPFLLNQGRFSVPVLNAIDLNYVPVFVSAGGTLYVPRRREQPHQRAGSGHEKPPQLFP